jgi:hypothetical protein
MNKLVSIVLLLGSLAIAFVALAQAEVQLPLGQVNNFVTDQNCPSVAGGPFPSGTVCYSGTVGSCSGTAAIGFTYGVLNTGGGASGTIVFFNGADGTGLDPAFNVDAVTYNDMGFQTVEVVWQSASGGPAAWEQSGAGTAPTSIKNAACRPATLLNWIFNGTKKVYTSGGKCAQGASAGSAAIAYSMAEYGASDYLDNVEFISGPPLANIKDGCDPGTASASVCSNSDTFCNNGGEGGWVVPYKYVYPANSAIDFWTGLISVEKDPPQFCTTTNMTTTLSSEFQTMSIVDGITGINADATLNYPSTAMGAWLCAYNTVANNTCGGTNPTGNNSPAEGELYYSSVSANPLHVYRVDLCSNSENVESPNSLVPANLGGLGHCALSGQTAITTDMINNCVPQTHGSRFRGLPRR